jgi:hypothetical protein
MEKFLMFLDDADDAATYPASRLLGMTCAGDGALLLKFEGSAMDTTVEEDNIDLITLTITADTEKAVMSEIARAINATASYNDGLIVVCDDVNSKFLHKNILSCTITLDA